MQRFQPGAGALGPGVADANLAGQRCNIPSCTAVYCDRLRLVLHCNCNVPSSCTAIYHDKNDDILLHVLSCIAMYCHIGSYVSVLFMEEALRNTPK